MCIRDRIRATQNAPLDSYVSFNVDGAKNNLTSWSLELKDQKGNTQYFGPYTQENMVLSGKTILGDQPQGDYKITMKGTKKDGTTIQKYASSHIVLWTPGKDEAGMRFSVLYEFNVAKAINIYEKYLADVLTPKIPVGSKVYIHGYTDIIGNETNNYNLSVARAHDLSLIHI